MKDKLKLILLLVVSAAVGIAIVLGSWLYGSYYQRMGLFTAMAEQALFEAVQDVAQDMQKDYPDSVIQSIQLPGVTALRSALMKEFPEISESRLKAISDSIFSDGRLSALERMDALREQHDKVRLTEGRIESPRKRFPGDDHFPRRRLHLIPFTFARGPIATDSIISTIRDKFEEQLVESNLHTSYVLTVEKFGPPDSSNQDRIAKLGKDILSIRPLLIDPQQGQFIVVHFDQPWHFLVYSMSWQLVVSVFILAIVLGTFFYLFITIIKQNRLDTLRKAFVNSLTHELRTPVTTVLVAVEALHDYIDADKDDIREQYHQMAIEELDHLSAMIDRVLDIADGDHNEERMMHTEYVDFSALVFKCVEHIKITCANKDIDIVFTESEQSLFLQGDPHHLKNVVNNLLDNAVKYGASHINVILEKNVSKNRVVLRVEDNGIGIPDAYQQQVFEPFFRVPRGDLYSVKGFGLGLPYVRRVLLQHRAKIQLKSEVGKGTTFIIEIPN